MGRLHLGTSGYAYAHWRGIFYPKGLAASKWLAFYARVFSTLELNNTFYRLPAEEAVDRWRAQTPPGFTFAAKGSRYLTHMKRLTDTTTGLDRFYARAGRLREKLAVVLWQLPPRMRCDPGRLDRFLAAQPAGVRQAVEFRDRDWYREEVCEVLDARGAAFVEHDLLDLPPPRLTGGFRYLRFHGATGRYFGRYGKRALRKVAEGLRAGRGEVFVYFNNDSAGDALRDALDLSALLGEPLPLELWPEPVARGASPG